jgi:glycosyltransferase involved in cell wall biosynthesis
LLAEGRKRERICIITADFPVLGGMRSVLLVLLRELAREAEPVVLSRRFGSSGFRQFDLSLSPRVRGWFSPWFLSSLPLYELSGFLWCVYLRVGGVRKFLVQDAVFSGLFVSLVCRLLGGELFLFEYGSAVNLDNGLLERELSQAQPRGAARLLLRVMRWIRWLSLRSCRVFFVHSGEMEALALASGVPARRMVEYRFPLESEVYRRDGKARLRLRRRLEVRRRFCLLYVGRMTVDKGLNLLVEAYKELVREYPGRLGLVMVGSGPEKEGLMSMCGGVEGVVFVDSVDDPARVAELMSAGDFFVYPVVYSGGIAMAVLEAMACELPVVVGAAGPTKEVIVEGENGFVMKAASADGIILATKYLLKYPKVRSVIGRRARETVVRDFGVEQYRRVVVERILR